jgi:phage shock protein C
MYCTRCGAQNTDGSKYCTVCGASLATGDASSTSGYSASGTASPYQTAAPARRLRRVIAEKKIAGVCAGFAEYFDMDVTLVRLIWLALVLIPPAPGVIIYIVAWIILPKG